MTPCPEAATTRSTPETRNIGAAISGKLRRSAKRAKGSFGSDIGLAPHALWAISRGHARHVSIMSGARPHSLISRTAGPYRGPALATLGTNSVQKAKFAVSSGFRSEARSIREGDFGARMGPARAMRGGSTIGRRDAVLAARTDTGRSGLDSPVALAQSRPAPEGRASAGTTALRNAKDETATCRDSIAKRAWYVVAGSAKGNTEIYGNLAPDILA